MGAAVSISHWFFIDFSLFMTLWAWLVFMFTEQSFIWCIFWKKFLPKFSWIKILLAQLESCSWVWKLETWQLWTCACKFKCGPITKSFGMGILWCQRLGTKGQYFLFMWSLTVTLLPRTLGGEGRVLDDRVSCIFLLQFSPSFVLLDISWYMTYKQPVSYTHLTLPTKLEV